jgi:hypothetical protein
MHFERTTFAVFLCTKQLTTIQRERSTSKRCGKKQKQHWMGLFFSEFVRCARCQRISVMIFFYNFDGKAFEVEEKIERQEQKQIEQLRKISNILYKLKHCFIVHSFKMATNGKSTTTAIPSLGPASTKPSRIPYARMVQNFLLFWLDASIDENNDDHCNNVTKLRQVIDTVKTFTDADECIDFITNIEKENIFIIISGTFSAAIVPVVQDMLQVSRVYILCKNKCRYEKWALQWSKVKGLFTDITSICEAVKLATQLYDQNMVSISFFKSNDEASNQNLDQLDQSFMYTRILKEILLTIDFKQKYIDEFVTYCRAQFVGNSTELRNVDKLEKEYRMHVPIWWYTSDGFLYSMFNRALRVMEVDLIIKMGFFIQDLHNHIAALHSTQ